MRDPARRIRSFDTATRNLSDLGRSPGTGCRTRLIVADPSHGIGHRDIGAGDGACSHRRRRRRPACRGAPELNAPSDGAQSLFPEQFDRMMRGRRDRRGDRPRGRRRWERGVKHALRCLVLLLPRPGSAQAPSRREHPGSGDRHQGGTVYRGLSGLQADFRQS